MSFSLMNILLTFLNRHFILHDWPDADCKKILSNQKAGMKKGYSKLLLHEVVLDANEPKETGTASDIAMMAMVSGMESK
jgi:hypothetical protein